MISEIHMEGVASFQQAVSLATDKRINLIYGLNGVGKSTISNYLYRPVESRFSKCSTTNPKQLPILVYNQQFIQDNFVEQDSLKGIFSLSKENKEAQSKIDQATLVKKQLEDDLSQKDGEKKQLDSSFNIQKQQAIDSVWRIKTQYSGGDRVLEYCLEGLMGKKDKLFEHISKIAKPIAEPTKNIEEIKKEVGAFKDDTSVEVTPIPKLDFNKGHIENNHLFSTTIIGNSDSEVAQMIEHLGNADWVKQGLEYLPTSSSETETNACPFCQGKTITSHFIHHIHSYFDETYQRNINNLEAFKTEYQAAIDQLPKLDSFTKNEFAENYVLDLTEKYNNLEKIFKDNLQKIEIKIKNPKTNQELLSSSNELQLFNQILEKIN